MLSKRWKSNKVLNSRKRSITLQMYKRLGLRTEGLAVSGQENSVYDSSEDGSGREKGRRQGDVIKHRCVPWRTAFFVLCFVSGLQRYRRFPCHGQH